MRYMLVVLMLCGIAVGQSPSPKIQTTEKSGMVVSSPKRCAFDLKPQTILDERPVKPAPKYQMFPQPPSMINMDPPYFPPMRTVCPYERAIELFGEDRVRFEEIYNSYSSDKPDCKANEIVSFNFETKKYQCWPPGTKRVLVDGEAVYEEGK